MVLGPRSIAVSHRVVLCIAQFPGGRLGAVRVVREIRARSLCPDDSVLGENRRYTLLRRESTNALRKRSTGRHSSFTERTQRSANAFRFGLRVGNFRGLTLLAWITSPNTGQNLPSRSCERVATVCQKAPILHRYISRLLLHPLLVRIRRDPGQHLHVGANEVAPARRMLALWCRGNAMALENISHRVVGNPMSEIGERPHHAIVAPRRILERG